LVVTLAIAPAMVENAPGVVRGAGLPTAARMVHTVAMDFSADTVFLFPHAALLAE